MTNAKFTPHLSASVAKMFVVFFVTGLSEDHKNSFYRRLRILLYVAALFSKMRTVSAFHRLLIRKSKLSSTPIKTCTAALETTIHIFLYILTIRIERQSTSYIKMKTSKKVVPVQSKFRKQRRFKSVKREKNADG